MDTSPLHIVFAGGGTAGHLFPGLAVAAELAAFSHPPRITFAGSGKGFEQRFVEAAGFEYLALASAPARFSPRGVVRFLANNLAGYRMARRFLRRERVSLVVGLGGYVSVPMARAAIAADKPLALLEQNVYPGKATRWFASRASLICTAFDETRRHLPHVGPVRVTGTPVRAGFCSNRRRRAGDDVQPHRLLVLGGSGGARSLNEFVPRALYKLGERLTGWEIVHQTGPHDVAATRELYRKLAMDAAVTPFVQNLPAVLCNTDLAICRAGGATLAELAASGVPAVMIPYPHAADNHQRINAEAFASAGAGRLIDERTIPHRLDDELVSVLSDLLNDRRLRRTMSAAMLEFARPDAAWQVAMMVHELAHQPIARRAA